MNPHEIRTEPADQPNEPTESALTAERIRPIYFVDIDYDEFETAMRRGRRLRSEAAVASIEWIARVVGKGLHRVGASVRAGIAHMGNQLPLIRHPLDADAAVSPKAFADEAMPDRAT